MEKHNAPSDENESEEQHKEVKIMCVYIIFHHQDKCVNSDRLLAVTIRCSMEIRLNNQKKRAFCISARQLFAKINYTGTKTTVADIIHEKLLFVNIMVI